MKTVKAILATALATLIITSCSSPRHVPPGQAKKATGSKSAKPFAPGQQKKH